MTLCHKFISYRRIQSKRAVLQEVILIDSCSCPMLVMLFCARGVHGLIFDFLDPDSGCVRWDQPDPGWIWIL